MDYTEMLFTNEKKNVPIDSIGTPTVPSTVTHETPLSDFNLNWTEKELPQKVRTRHVHGLHPYLGKYIPQLVEIFLRKYFSKDQCIIDPFCGSGTTLVQANELGIASIGCDISAFNVLLSKVKTERYDLELVTDEVTDILEQTRQTLQRLQINTAKQLSLWDSDNYTQKSGISTTNPYLLKWYAPQSLQELLTYHQLIKIGHYKYPDVLKIILSRAARSARLTTHFDLDFPKKPQTEPYWCYKHSRTCQPIQEAFKFLKRYSMDIMSRLKTFAAVQTKANVTILHNDSRSVTLPTTIDGVMTSPPYVGLIDYHEQHAYAYHLLGLKDKRKQEIGPAIAGTSQKALKQYQQDIADVFQHIMEYMPKGARLIVVAGDQHQLYEHIAKMIEVEIEQIVTRQVNRRTGRRASEFYESVFIWGKR
jgi:uncharacterized protein YbgA (DUF1722 family)